MSEFEALWEGTGRRVAASLDFVSAAIVIGDDPIATASVALGIGRQQALRRRVAVGDLIGDAAPLRALIAGDDDPHGISDSFLYGVSLNKIARQVDQVGNLFVLPTGSESALQDEVLRNERWRRLAGGFREVDALLLLVAPASVPGIEQLIDQLDGVVLVGGAQNPSANVPVLTDVPGVVRRTPARTPPRLVVPSAAPARGGVWRTVALVAFLLAALGAGLFAARGQFAGTSDGGRTPAPPPRADSQPSRAAVVAVDSMPAIDSTVVPLEIANPNDSSLAAAFAVEIAAESTTDGARARLRDGARPLPAATVSPVLLSVDRSQWFKVVTGAFRDSRQAEALLARLRRTGTVPQTAGAVIRAPLALRLAGPTARDSAQQQVSEFVARGIMAYALAQPDGRAVVLVGAFETPAQAELLAATLKTANIDATLVYRVGSTF